VMSMVQIEQALKQTLTDNDEMMSQIVQTKHVRADRMIRLK
jgi:hypothetical protein